MVSFVNEEPNSAKNNRRSKESQLPDLAPSKLIRNNSVKSVERYGSKAEKEQNLLEELMRDRHKQEMADFLREVKHKEISRMNMIEQAPDHMAAKLGI